MSYRDRIEARRSSRQMHYWIVAQSEEGKPYLVYGGIDENSCRQKGLEMLGGLDFNIKAFPTRDMATASAMLRGVRLDRGLGLRRSAQRQGHERTIKRDILRRRRR